MAAMAQDSLSRAARQERVSEELAERLDSLTLPLAQSVLGRAVELDAQAQQEAEAAAETMDYETLREVALEAGISEASLKKALLEEFDTEIDHNARPVERMTVPDKVRGGLIVSGALDEVVAKIERHLESVGRRGAHPTHHGPGSLVVTTRTGQPIEVRTVTQRHPDRQLVAVDVGTRSTRTKAWQWLIGAGIIALLFGSSFGGLVFLAVLIAGIAGVVSWVKRIGRFARRTVNRALGSLIDGDDEPSEWLDLWDRSGGR